MTTELTPVEPLGLYNTCPLLGMRSDRLIHTLNASTVNVCFRDGPESPRAVRSEHQTEYCLTGEHILCPFYNPDTIVVVPPLVQPQSVPPLNRKRRRKKRRQPMVTGIVLVAIVFGLLGFTVRQFLVSQADAVATSESMQVAADSAESQPASADITKQLPSPTPDAPTAAADLIVAAGVTPTEIVKPTTTPLPTVVPSPTRQPQPTRVVTATATTEATATPTATAEPTSTPTLAPTETPVPTATPLPAPTNPPPPMATATPAVSQPLLRVSTGAANVRTGPSIDYEPITVVYEDEIVTAIARTVDSWYFVELADGTRGWVAFNVVEPLNQNTVSDLPIVTGP